MHVVIRAGGVGLRLWPVSRRQKPKQFHAFVGEQTLFRDAYERALGCAADVDNVYVSCPAGSVDLVQEQIPELSDFNIIREPCAKNTGPAMCLEAAVLETRLDPDDVVCTIPSDDYIGRVDAFVSAMRFAEYYIHEKNGSIVTPCAPATVVDTGFCYVEPGDVLYQDDRGGFFTVNDWVEKPGSDRCQMLVDAGTSFVHMGMYVYRLGAMIEIWENLHPALLHVCRLVARDVAGAKEQYEKIVAESIETLVTKHESRVAMQVIPDVGWSDVGKWHVVKRLLQNEVGGNVVRGNVELHNTRNSLVYGLSEKATAVIGMDNVIVVDTKDGLLVAHGEKSHEIKDVIDRIDQGYL